MNELQSARDAVAVVAALHRGDPQEADLLLSLMSRRDRDALIGSLAAIASTCIDACDRISPGAGTALLESLVTDLAQCDTLADGGSSPPRPLARGAAPSPRPARDSPPRPAANPPRRVLLGQATRPALPLPSPPRRPPGPRHSRDRPGDPAKPFATGSRL